MTFLFFRMYFNLKLIFMRVKDLPITLILNLRNFYVIMIGTFS